jgi:transcription elongation factor Elf1
MQICPRCQQGCVVEVRLLRTATRLFVCKECEATWQSRDSIGTEPWNDFETYLRDAGRTLGWAEVELIESK